MAARALPVHPNGTSAGTTAATVGTASAEALAASALRKRLIVHNPNGSALVAYRLTGGTAVLSGAGAGGGSFILHPGATHVWDGAEAQGQITAVASAGSTPLTLVAIS